MAGSTMSSAPPGSRSVLEPCASSPTVSIDPHKRRLGVHTTAGFTSYQVAGPGVCGPALARLLPDRRRAPCLDGQHVVMPLVTRAMRVLGHVSSARTAARGATNL